MNDNLQSNLMVGLIKGQLKKAQYYDLSENFREVDTNASVSGEQKKVLDAQRTIIEQTWEGIERQWSPNVADEKKEISQGYPLVENKV